MEIFYDFIIKKDIEFIKWSHECAFKSPRFYNLMQRIVSKNPFQDIVFVLVPFFILGLIECGIPHFWLVYVNCSLIFGIIVFEK